jgi:hypothetical protein
MPLKRDVKRFWKLFRATPLRTLFLVLSYRQPEPWERRWHTTRLRIPLVIEGRKVCNRNVQMRCVYLGSWWLGDDAWALRLGPNRPVTLIR